MSQGLCPSCGAAVNLTAGQTDTKCHYCDSVVTQQQAEAQFSEVKHSKFAGTLMIAETAQEGGSYAEAINYYNKVIEQDPTFADAWLNKGICMVRTSKIGDLKIPEAISSWRTAIKFAKNPEAMKKRVATEINIAVTAFYPVLEQHYLQFHTQDDSLQEHGNRFLLLESALALALDYHPSAVIAKNGIALCDGFVVSMKTVQKAFAVKGINRFWIGDVSKYDLEKAVMAESAAAVMGLASERVANTLKQTKVKYEDALARNDPDYRAVLNTQREADYVVWLKYRLESAEKQGKVSASKMAAGCGCLGLVLLGLSLIAYFSSPSGKVLSIANWLILLLVPVAIVVAFRFNAKRLRLAEEAAIDFTHSAHATDPAISFKDEEMIGAVERGLVKGCSSAEMRKALVEVLKKRGLPQTEGFRYLQAFDGIQKGRDIATLGLSDTPVSLEYKNHEASTPTEPAYDSRVTPKARDTEQQTKANLGQALGPHEIGEAINPLKSILVTIAHFVLMLFSGVVVLLGILLLVTAMLPGKEGPGVRILLALFGLAAVAGGIVWLRKIRNRIAASKG